jgi:hypothetical protein
VGIDWFRDLVICIWGVLAIIFLIIDSILFYLLYKRLQKFLNAADAVYNKGYSILNDLENTSSSVQGIINDMKEKVVNPIVQVMAVIQGIRQVIGIFSQSKKKGDESEDGE